MPNTLKKKIINEKKMAVSGYRMLELLKALAKSPLSPQEMLQILEEKTDNIYRKELVLKYINTLKLIGLDIEKTKDKYVLKKNLKQIDLSYNDLSCLKFLENYVKDIPINNFQENLYNVFQVIEKSISPQTIERIRNSIIKPSSIKKNDFKKDETVQKFEKYCTDGLKLLIIYQNDKNEEPTKYKIVPIKTLYKKRKIVLIAYDCLNNEYKEFLLDLILSSEQTPQKSIKNYDSTVTFKLTGRLAKSYVLKNKEHVLECNKDYLIITNTGEDKDLLIRRLVRYYDSCEILYPKTFRNNMLAYLDKIESVYKNHEE